MTDSFEPPKINTGFSDKRSSYERLRSGEGGPHKRRAPFPGGSFSFCIIIVGLVLDVVGAVYLFSIVAAGELNEIEKVTSRAGFSVKYLAAMEGAILFFSLVANSMLLCRIRFAIWLGIIVVSASLLITASARINLNRLAEVARDGDAIMAIVTQIVIVEVAFSIVYVIALVRFAQGSKLPRQ